MRPCYVHVHEEFHSLLLLLLIFIGYSKAIPLCCTQDMVQLPGNDSGHYHGSVDGCSHCNLHRDWGTTNQILICWIAIGSPSDILVLYPLHFKTNKNTE